MAKQTAEWMSKIFSVVIMLSTVEKTVSGKEDRVREGYSFKRNA